MKLRIEATSSDELRDRAPVLLGKLAKALRAHAPQVADVLEKAGEQAEAPREMQHRALRDGVDRVHREYAAMLDVMLGEIEQVLDDHVKALAPKTMTRAEHKERYELAKSRLAALGYNEDAFDGADLEELEAVVGVLEKGGTP